MIQMLEEIGESGFQSAAFLTYGVDLSFFEAKVMNRLQETGCRNVIVVADGHQAKDALNSAAQLRYVGVQCPLVTVRLGNRAFHPKAVLMVGEEKLKVLIGSGNLTLPGYTRNWEMFTKLEGREVAGAALELLDVFKDAAAWSPLEPAFDAWRRRLENSSPWLFGEKANGQSLQLLSSSVAPILPRVKDLIAGLKVDEILVASPFFDADASALRWLVDNFSPERLTLLLDDGAQLDSARVEEVLATISGEGSVRRFVRAGRLLHGKLLLFKGSWGEALLTGSPNASSAALLGRAGRGRGNFELATFRFGATNEFSALVEDRIGEPVSLQQLNLRRPYLIEQRVSPLELEAVWVSEGSLFALPAEKVIRDWASIDLAIDRGSYVTTVRLDKSEDGSFLRTLTDGERFQMESGPARARLVGSNGESGAPVWVQNLDAVEKRANPVQRPRYPRGLHALERDLLGPEWESWNSLFEAFSTFSNSWLRYAEARKPRSPRSTERKAGSQQAWDPEFFYISRDEVTLELPRYFAKVENSGVAIGDFEYLISALPSARKASDDAATYGEESTDALVDEEAPEDEDAEHDEDIDKEETEPRPEVTEEHLQWLRKRLDRKFRSIIKDYEDSIAEAPVENKAEASYLCLPYPALQKAIMISAREGLIDAWQLRELASHLTSAWTTKLWKDVPDKDELEDRLACAATSLATVATLTSPWLRQFVGVDEFDYDLYKQLRESLGELRPVFLTLRKAYDAGEERPEWQKLVEEYNKLRHVELEEKHFASWTPLQVLDDLERRYRAWDLDETPPWQKIADELGIGGAVRRDEEVLRVRATLPHVGEQERILARLLYSVSEGTQNPAAVLWDNEDTGGNIRRKAMVMCPDLNAVLEISFFRTKRPLLRRHRITGGSAGNGVHLTSSQYQTFSWRGGLIHPMNADQTTLFGCVAATLPELPVATGVGGYAS